MRAPWTDREHGGRDMRLLPAAAGMWTAALAAAPLMQPHNTRTLITVAAVLVCSVGGMALAAWMAHVTRNHAAFARRAATVLMLALAGLLLGAMAAVTHTAMRAADPVYAASAQGAALGIYRVRTTAPTLRANDREADCAVDVTVEQAVLDGVQQSAHASATLQASGRVCAMIEQGARYTVHGTAQRAAWDTARVILTAHTATMHEAAMPWWHGIETLRARFFAVTARLDDQGRVLVPGVTLGLLGQDILTGARVDETYARQLEERCKQAGIMHVMAVSGGHYALIARLCTIIGALARLPRGVLAMLRLATAGMLTMLLVPGQSVTRALSMSVFAVGYALCKRPCQTMHALCWTTMFALLTDPTRAANFGFALSCSAVCGIAMMMPRIQAWCARWMPRGAAQALAMTVSAQVFTLPVQILISPQVPPLVHPGEPHGGAVHRSGHHHRSARLPLRHSVPASRPHVRHGRLMVHTSDRFGGRPVRHGGRWMHPVGAGGPGYAAHARRAHRRHCPAHRTAPPARHHPPGPPPGPAREAARHASSGHRTPVVAADGHHAHGHTMEPQQGVNTHADCPTIRRH